MSQVIAKTDTVIVGAGIAGCSIAYHLAEMGYIDAIVIDRGKMSNPLGSTGHAPGLLGRNSASPTMAALADYTADLYAQIPVEKPALTRVGSIEVVRDYAGAELLSKKLKSATAKGIEAHLLSLDELKEKVPYMDISSVKASIFIPGDGALDARRGLTALYESAKQSGIRFMEEVTVTDFQNEKGHISGVVTDRGIIQCNRVVVAVGIWGRAFLKNMGINLPLYAVQHPYVYTKKMDMLADTEAEATRPMIRDLDNVFYLREHSDRFGYGWYNHKATLIDAGTITKADIAFPDEGFLEAANYDLFPFLKETELEVKLNGIFSMTPDGGPLLGEIKERPGLWIAEAVWVTHSGGVGKAMAEALTGKEPSFNIAQFSPDRFDEMSEENRLQASLDLYNDIYHWSDNGEH